MIIIPREEFFIEDEDKNSYRERIFKFNLKTFVEYRESFKRLFESYPFMKDFVIINSIGETFSSEKMNTYLGYFCIPNNSKLTSFTINIFINAYFEKQSSI